MKILIHLKVLATTSVMAFAAVSCAPTTVVTTAAENVPAGQRVTLDSSATGEQKSKIREAIAARFGGFDVGQWGRSGVIGAVLVSVNGQNGENRYYDGRGTFNITSTGAFAVSCAPGALKIVAKPDHYQIPSRYENRFDFKAKPGHQYFIGYIVDESGGQFRWVPVVYDKTEESVILLPGIQTQSSPKPVKITIYV
jgi:hypothetical protein